MSALVRREEPALLVQWRQRLNSRLAQCALRWHRSLPATALHVFPRNQNFQRARRRGNYALTKDHAVGHHLLDQSAETAHVCAANGAAMRLRPNVAAQKIVGTHVADDRIIHEQNETASDGNEGCIVDTVRVCSVIVTGAGRRFLSFPIRHDCAFRGRGRDWRGERRKRRGARKGVAWKRGEYGAG